MYLTHRIFSKIAFLVVVCLSCASFAQTTKLKWTDNTEKSTITADFVRMADDAVVLRKDGKEISVPLSKLSLSSHLQAKKLANPTAYSAPPPKAQIGIEQTDESRRLLVSPFPADATVEQFLEIFKRESDANNMLVSWHALTPKMQTDVEDLVASAMDQGGTGLLVQIKTLSKNVSTLMHDKKPFFLNSPLAPPPNRQQIDLMWPLLTEFADSLTDKKNWDAANFKPGMIAPWLAAMQVKSSKASAPLMRLAEQLAPQSPKKFEYKIVSKTDTEAVIEVLGMEMFNSLTANQPQPGEPGVAPGSAPNGAPNQPAAGYGPPAQSGGGYGPPNQAPGGGPGQNAGRRPPAKPMPVTLVKVEGRWLPKDMVEGWDAGIADAKSGLQVGMPMASGLLGTMVIPVVASLANARTQQEFNTVVNRIMQMTGGNRNNQQAGGYPGAPGGGYPGSGAPGGYPGMSPGGGDVNSGGEVNSGGAPRAKSFSDGTSP